ncbi:MAG: hypothetical protein QOF02_1425, partial [Blastocatellia bacterium]|nr:hypothetical protein [Blastocatellia bacterium]
MLVVVLDKTVSSEEAVDDKERESTFFIVHGLFA